MKNCGIVKNLLKLTSINMTSISYDFSKVENRQQVDSEIDKKLESANTSINASEYAKAIEQAKANLASRKAQNCAAAAAKVTPAGPQTAKSVKI